MADVFLFRFAVDGEGSFDDVTLREQRLDHLKSINTYRVKLTNTNSYSCSNYSTQPVLIVCVPVFLLKPKCKEKNINIYVRTEEKAQKSALVGSPGCEKVCGHSIMYAVRTSGDKSVSSLPPSSGTLLLFSFLASQWRELINFSPDVLTA